MTANLQTNIVHCIGYNNCQSDDHRPVIRRQTQWRRSESSHDDAGWIRGLPAFEKTLRQASRIHLRPTWKYCGVTAPACLSANTNRTPVRGFPPLALCAAHFSDTHRENLCPRQIL